VAQAYKLADHADPRLDDDGKLAFIYSANFEDMLDQTNQHPLR